LVSGAVVVVGDEVVVVVGSSVVVGAEVVVGAAVVGGTVVGAVVATACVDVVDAATVVEVLASSEPQATATSAMAASAIAMRNPTRRVDVLVVMNCLLDMDGQVDGLAGVSSDETNVSAAGRDVVPQKSDYTVIPED
jgi:hypothetical protein